MMDNGSDDEQEDLLSGMSDLEKLKQGLAKHLPASSVGAPQLN